MLGLKGMDGWILGFYWTSNELQSCKSFLFAFNRYLDILLDMEPETSKLIKLLVVWIDRYLVNLTSLLV